MTLFHTDTHTGYSGPTVPGNHCPYQWLYIIHYAVLYDPISHRHTHRVFRAHSSWQSLSLPMAVYHTLRCPIWPYFTQTHTQGIQGPQFLAITVPTNGCISYITLSYMTLFHTDTHTGYSGPTVPGNHCPYQWLYIIHYAVLYDPISHRHTHRVFRAHSSWQSLSLPMAVYHTLRCPRWPYFTQTHTQGIQGPQFLAITVPTNGCISYITLSYMTLFHTDTHTGYSGPTVPGNHCPYQWLYIIHYAVLYDPISHRHTHRVFRAHSSWQSLSLPMAVYHTLRCPIWLYFTQTHTQGIQGPQFLAIIVPTNGCISYITLSYMTLFHTDTHTGYSGPTVPGNHCPYQWLYIIHYAVLYDSISHRHTHTGYSGPTVPGNHCPYQWLYIIHYAVLYDPISHRHTHRVFRAHSSWQSLSLPMAVYHTLRCPRWPYFTQTHTQGIQGPQFLAITVPTNGCISYITLSYMTLFHTDTHTGYSGPTVPGNHCPYQWLYIIHYAVLDDPISHRHTPRVFRAHSSWQSLSLPMAVYHTLRCPIWPYFTQTHTQGIQGQQFLAITVPTNGCISYITLS